MKNKVDLLDHDPHWAESARCESLRFAAAVGEDPRLLRIHHIGSTSIPGIVAKPIIDLLPEVCSLEWLDERRPQIEAAGYEFWGEYGIPRRRFCPRNDPQGLRQANLHCFLQGDEHLIRHLAFRDYLWAHPQVAREYEQVKQDCARRHPDEVQAYSDCKSDWIIATQQAALEWWWAR